MNEEQKRFCKYCGAEITQSTKICKNCGSIISKEQGSKILYTDPDGIFPADRGSSTSCCHGIPDDQMDSGGVQPQQYRTVCLMRCGYGIGVSADLSAGVCADFPQLL